MTKIPGILTLAFVFSGATAAADEDVCACGPFDKPDKIVREASVEFHTAHRVVGTEIYLANTWLRAGSAEATFVIAGEESEEPGRVRFRARTKITLGPGFHAQKGSRFEASIEPLRLAQATRSVWPTDTEAANRNPDATTAVVLPDANVEPPDPYAIPPMRPPRRSSEGGL